MDTLNNLNIQPSEDGIKKIAATKNSSGSAMDKWNLLVEEYGKAKFTPEDKAFLGIDDIRLKSLLILNNQNELDSNIESVLLNAYKKVPSFKSYILRVYDNFKSMGRSHTKSKYSKVTSSLDNLLLYIHDNTENKVIKDRISKNDRKRLSMAENYINNILEPAIENALKREKVKELEDKKKKAAKFNSDYPPLSKNEIKYFNLKDASHDLDDVTVKKHIEHFLKKDEYSRELQEDEQINMIVRLLLEIRYRKIAYSHDNGIKPEIRKGDRNWLGDFDDKDGDGIKGFYTSSYGGKIPLEKIDPEELSSQLNKYAKNAIKIILGGADEKTKGEKEKTDNEHTVSVYITNSKDNLGECVSLSESIFGRGIRHITEVKELNKETGVEGVKKVYTLKPPIPGKTPIGKTRFLNELKNQKVKLENTYLPKLDELSKVIALIQKKVKDLNIDSNEVKYLFTPMPRDPFRPMDLESQEELYIRNIARNQGPTKAEEIDYSALKAASKIPEYGVVGMGTYRLAASDSLSEFYSKVDKIKEVDFNEVYDSLSEDTKYLMYLYKKYASMTSSAPKTNIIEDDFSDNPYSEKNYERLKNLKGEESEEATISSLDVSDFEDVFSRVITNLNKIDLRPKGSSLGHNIKKLLENEVSKLPKFIDIPKIKKDPTEKSELSESMKYVKEQEDLINFRNFMKKYNDKKEDYEKLFESINSYYLIFRRCNEALKDSKNHDNIISEFYDLVKNTKDSFYAIKDQRVFMKKWRGRIRGLRSASCMSMEKRSYIADKIKEIRNELKPIICKYVLKEAANKKLQPEDHILVHERLKKDKSKKLTNKFFTDFPIAEAFINEMIDQGFEELLEDITKKEEEERVKKMTEEEREKSAEVTRRIIDSRINDVISRLTGGEYLKGALGSEWMQKARAELDIDKYEKEYNEIVGTEEKVLDEINKYYSGKGDKVKKLESYVKFFKDPYRMVMEQLDTEFTKLERKEDLLGKKDTVKEGPISTRNPILQEKIVLEIPEDKGKEDEDKDRKVNHFKLLDSLLSRYVKDRSKKIKGDVSWDHYLNSYSKGIFSTFSLKDLLSDSMYKRFEEKTMAKAKKLYDKSGVKKQGSTAVATDPKIKTPSEFYLNLSKEFSLPGWQDDPSDDTFENLNNTYKDMRDEHGILKSSLAYIKYTESLLTGRKRLEDYLSMYDNELSVDIENFNNLKKFYDKNKSKYNAHYIKVIEKNIDDIVNREICREFKNKLYDDLRKNNMGHEEAEYESNTMHSDKNILNAIGKDTIRETKEYIIKSVKDGVSLKKPYSAVEWRMNVLEKHINKEKDVFNSLKSMLKFTEDFIKENNIEENLRDAKREYKKENISNLYSILEGAEEAYDTDWKTRSLSGDVPDNLDEKKRVLKDLKKLEKEYKEKNKALNVFDEKAIFNVRFKDKSINLKRLKIKKEEKESKAKIILPGTPEEVKKYVERMNKDIEISRDEFKDLSEKRLDARAQEEQIERLKRVIEDEESKKDGYDLIIESFEEFKDLYTELQNDRKEKDKNKDLEELKKELRNDIEEKERYDSIKDKADSTPIPELGIGAIDDKRIREYKKLEIDITNKRRKIVEIEKKYDDIMKDLRKKYVNFYGINPDSIGLAEIPEVMRKINKFLREEDPKRAIENYEENLESLKNTLKEKENKLEIAQGKVDEIYEGDEEYVNRKIKVEFNALDSDINILTESMTKLFHTPDIKAKIKLKRELYPRLINTLEKKKSLLEDKGSIVNRDLSQEDLDAYIREIDNKIRDRKGYYSAVFTKKEIDDNSVESHLNSSIILISKLIHSANGLEGKIKFLLEKSKEYRLEYKKVKEEAVLKASDPEAKKNLTKKGSELYSDISRVSSEITEVLNRYIKLSASILKSFLYEEDVLGEAKLHSNIKSYKGYDKIKGMINDIEEINSKIDLIYNEGNIVSKEEYPFEVSDINNIKQNIIKYLYSDLIKSFRKIKDEDIGGNYTLKKVAEDLKSRHDVALETTGVEPSEYKDSRIDNRLLRELKTYSDLIKIHKRGDLIELVHGDASKETISEKTKEIYNDVKNIPSFNAIKNIPVEIHGEKIRLEDIPDKFNDDLDRYYSRRTQLKNQLENIKDRKLKVKQHIDVLKDLFDYDEEGKKIKFKGFNKKQLENMRKLIVTEAWKQLDSIWSKLEHEKYSESIKVLKNRKSDWYDNLYASFKGLSFIRANKKITSNIEKLRLEVNTMISDLSDTLSSFGYYKKLEGDGGVIQKIRAGVGDLERGISSFTNKYNDLKGDVLRKEEKDKIRNDLKEKGFDPRVLEGSYPSLVKDLNNKLTAIKEKKKSIEKLFVQISVTVISDNVGDRMEEDDKTESEGLKEGRKIQKENRKIQKKIQKENRKIKETDGLIEGGLKDLNNLKKSIDELKEIINKDGLKIPLGKLEVVDAPKDPSRVEVKKEVVQKESYDRSHKDFNINVFYSSTIQNKIATLIAEKLNL